MGSTPALFRGRWAVALILVAAQAQLSSAERLDVLWSRAGHAEGIVSVDVTPSGDRVLTASLDDTVKVWDPVTGEMLYSLRILGPASLSPDGTLFAVHKSGILEVRQISDGALIRSLGSTTFTRPAWSPNWERVASADSANVVRVRDVNTGVQQLLLSGHASLVRCLAWSSDGAFIVTGAGLQGTDNTARIWSATSGAQLRILSGHSDYIGSVAVSPDSATIATGSGDDTVKLWDSSSGALIRTLPASQWPAWTLTFSPDGEVLAMIDIGGTLRLWNIADGTLRFALVLPHGGRSVRYMPDGRTLVIGSNYGSPELRSSVDGTLLQTLGVNNRELAGVAFSSDGTTLAYGDVDGRAVRVRGRDGAFQDERDVPGFLNDSGLVFSPDLGIAASLSGFNTDTQFWDLDADEAGHALTGHISVIYRSTFSPDGQLFATAGEYQAGLWNAQTGEFIHWFQNSLMSHHGSVAFSQDGTKVALGEFRGAKVFDVATGQVLHTLVGDAFSFSSIALSPDGQLLVAADFSEMWAWDLTDGSVAWTDSSAIGVGSDLFFSRDGRHVFSCGRDGIVRIRSAADGVITHTFDEETGPWIRSMAMSPTGRTFAIARTDATLVVARNPVWTVGDIDGDGCVTLDDLSLLLADFGRTDEPAFTDLDDSGATDLADLSSLLSNFGACGD